MGLGVAAAADRRRLAQVEDPVQLHAAIARAGSARLSAKSAALLAQTV